MNPYNYSNNFHIPSSSTVLGLASAWLTFIAVSVGLSLGNAASPGDQVIRLLIAVGTAAAAVTFLLMGLRLRGSEEEVDSLLRAAFKPQPSPRQEEPNTRAA